LSDQHQTIKATKEMHLSARCSKK